MKPASNPYVSVIIPSYNRQSELALLLDSLNHQTMPSSQFEVIVVDDGSTDGTRTYVEQEQHKWGDRLKIVFQNRVGPGAARNEGVKASRGEILAFIDSDCKAMPRWLERLCFPFQDSSVGAVGGPEVLNPEDPLLVKCFHYVMTSPLTTGGMRGKQGLRLARYYPRSFNMALSRKAFEKVGGFLPIFHGEDIELTYRIQEAGYRALFVEGATVYHRRRQTLATFFTQLKKMGEARALLFSLHPDMLEPLHALPAVGLVMAPGLALVALLQPGLRYPVALVSGIALFYLLTTATTGALQLRQTLAGPLVAVAFLVQQSAYGFGFLKGFWEVFAARRKRPSRAPSQK